MDKDGTMTLLERFSNWCRRVQRLLENVAKAIIILVVLSSTTWFGLQADPGKPTPFYDRILIWSFVVFAVGLAELFVLMVVMTVLGKIDLPRAFYEKSDAEEVENTPPAEPADPETEARERDAGAPAALAKKNRGRLRNTNAVSLSRLQAFLWTLIVLTVYFHRVVKSGSGDLPTIPPELLMAMGISGAVYLASKGITTSAAKQTEGAKK